MFLLGGIWSMVAADESESLMLFSTTHILITKTFINRKEIEKVSIFGHPVHNRLEVGRPVTS